MDFTRRKIGFENTKTQVGTETGRSGAETGARAPKTKFFEPKAGAGAPVNSNSCASAPICALGRRLSVLNSDFSFFFLEFLAQNHIFEIVLGP